MTEPHFVVVLDFEANCTDERTRDHEVCEFPAVLVDLQTQRIVDEFRYFVKGVRLGRISNFIRQLTHITDDDINGQNSLSWNDALDEFEKWIFDKHQLTENAAVIVCCGNWDLKEMLPRQLRLTNTYLSERMLPFLSNWHNVKESFASHFQLKKQRGMAGMLAHLDLTLDGHHHSGIDDCRNIAKIVLALSKAGVSIDSNQTTANSTIDYPMRQCPNHK